MLFRAKKLKISLISLLLISITPMHGWSLSELASQADQAWQNTKKSGEREFSKIKQAGTREFKKAEQAVESAFGRTKTQVAQTVNNNPAAAKLAAQANQAYQQAQTAGTQAFNEAKTQATRAAAAGSQGFNDLKNKATEALGALSDQAKSGLRAKFNTENPRRDTPSQVYSEPGVMADENNVITQRLPKVQANTAKFLAGKLPENITLTADNTPRIGIVASGGGYRAMISTLGFMMGLEKTGVLDSTLYMSALSGSTWMLAPWNTLNLKLTDLNEYLRKYSYNSQQIIDPITDPKQIQKVANNFLRKELFNNPISSVDLYGALLANKLFGSLPNRQNIYLADQAPIIQDGSRVFPIYTSVEPSGKNQYRWYEFTPFTFGSSDLNQYINIWAMGRRFQNGQAKALTTLSGAQYGPDMPLGFLLGICGSAYTVSLDEMIKLMDNSPLDNTQRIAFDIFKKHVFVEGTGHWRVYPAFVPNFMAGISGNPLAQTQDIKLVDAGLDSNLPFVPLIGPRRKLDILIALDASNPINSGEALQISEKRARERGYKFPKIDYNGLDKRSFTVFSDPDPETPIVVYVPLVRDESLPGLTANPVLSKFDPQVCANTSFCSTFNFKYNPDQFEQLRQSAEFNVLANSENFWNAIKDAVIRKTKTT